MITTGSKFFYGLAATILVAAVAYGYSTGGNNVGPISLGYKGGVGDLVGYTLLIGGGLLAAFLGFALTAFRDADPAAAGALLGAEAPPVPSVPSSSYWPLIGAFGVALVVVGVVLNNVFFVAGLIVLGAVAVEWTVQAWAERATGDPAVNREIRNRIMLPLEIPVAGAAIVAVLIVGYSRVFLSLSSENAVWAALAVAAVIFGGGAIFGSRPKVRTDLIAGVLVVAAVVTIGLGILAAVNGERSFEEHEGAPSGEHSSAVIGGATTGGATAPATEAAAAGIEENL